ncbi:MAG: hypothetical protein M3Z32_09825 [Acidobacteriota bacterium]|nr:hypothetical protein [Acidobacteriota bacterium]
MNIVKAAIAWLIKLPDIVICAIADGILAALTNNANYPKPAPPLSDVASANEVAKAAIAAAASGGRVLTAIKDARMAELGAVVRPLAYYVTITANGDMAKLLSSGFPVQQSTRKPIGPLPTPTAPVATPGDLFGTIDATTAPIHGAYVYNWRVATAAAPTVFVVETTTTKANTKLVGLTRAVIYNVQVSVMGPAGATEWSDAANITAP